MKFLLDTNIISEWSRPTPFQGVVDWFDKTDEDQIFLPVPVLAELGYGIERLPVGARRDRLFTWLIDEVVPRFEGRILPVDTKVSLAWGGITATAQGRGYNMDAMDAVIAATAACYGMTLVTRNTKDFDIWGIALFNPWAPVETH